MHERVTASPMLGLDAAGLARIPHEALPGLLALLALLERDRHRRWPVPEAVGMGWEWQVMPFVERLRTTRPDRGTA